LILIDCHIHVYLLTWVNCFLPITDAVAVTRHLCLARPRTFAGKLHTVMFVKVLTQRNWFVETAFLPLEIENRITPNNLDIFVLVIPRVTQKVFGAEPYSMQLSIFTCCRCEKQRQLSKYIICRKVCQGFFRINFVVMI